jgi:pilus assembly protein CpaB
MNQRFISVLVFAFVVAAGASLLLYRLMAARVPPKVTAPTQKVILAAHNLEVGAMIKDSDLKAGDWSGPLPLNAITKKEDVVGRGVVSTVYDGGVAGFVVAGMRVDILISGNPPQGNGSQGTITKTLLQNIEVLSAGQEFKKDVEGKPISVGVINVLVTPQQAEILSLASNQTTIQLVLRNPLDTQVAKTSGAGVQQLFGGPPPRVASDGPAQPVRRVRPVAVAAPPATIVRAEPKPQPFVIEMIHGSRKAEQKFAEEK